MNHHPSVGQMFECFVVGLAVVAAVIVVLGAVAFLFYLAEVPVKRWFLKHRRIGKAVVVGGWSFLGLALTFAVYYLGCAICLMSEGR